MTDDDQRPPPELWLRATVAAVLAGLTGCFWALTVAHILGELSAPDFGRYVLPANHAATYAELAARAEAASGTPAVLWIVLVVSVITLLLLPMCVNPRWISRDMLSLGGLGKWLSAMLLIGITLVMFPVQTGVLGTLPMGTGSSPGPALSDALAKGLLPGCSGALLFGLFAPDSVLGAAGSRKDPDATLRRSLIAALLGFGVGLLCALSGFYVLGKMRLLFHALWGFLGEFVEVSPLGYGRLSLGLALGWALPAAALAALMVIAAPLRASRPQRMLGGVAAVVPALAALTLGTWFESYCMNRGEMRLPTLQAAADLSAPPPDRLLVIGGPGGPVAIAYPMYVTASGFADSERVGASAENQQRIRDYLDQRGERWTVHTIKAWEARAAIPLRRFDPVAAHAELMADAERTGSLLATALLVSRLRLVPVNDASRALAAQVLDPSRFVAQGRSQAYLAPVAARFGDLPRAQALYDGGLRGGYQPDPDERRPSAVPLHDGQLVGAVMIGGEPAGDLQVGLFGAPPGTELSERPRLRQLLAAVTTDDRGRYEFTGLTPQRYRVGVLLPDHFDASGHPALRGRLGPVVISEQSRSVDLAGLHIDGFGSPAGAPAR